MSANRPKKTKVTKGIALRNKKPLPAKTLDSVGDIFKNMIMFTDFNLATVLTKRFRDAFKENVFEPGTVIIGLTSAQADTAFAELVMLVSGDFKNGTGMAMLGKDVSREKIRDLLTSLHGGLLEDKNLKELISKVSKK